MKTLMHIPLLMLAALPISLKASAQQDSTLSAEPRHATVSLGFNSKDGLQASVQDQDTTKSKGNLTFDMKYKRITIITEKKPWVNEADSISSVLRDKRRERRNQFTHWAGIDVGVNALLDDGSPDLGPEKASFQVDHGRSRFTSINFMEQKVEFGSHHAGLMTGLGWEFVNYRFRNNVLLAYDKDTVTATAIDSPDLRKNKLRQMGFRVPLMLEFNTKRAPLPTAVDLAAMRSDTTGTVAKRFKHSRKGNFHLAFGVVGSWYFDTMYKQKWVEDGETRRMRDKGDYQLLPYRAAAAVRIGYGGLNLFAEYALTPLFKEGKGPELMPVTVGLSLIGFN